VGAALVFLAAIGLIWDWMRQTPKKAARNLRTQNQAWIKAALQKEIAQKPSLKVTDPAQVRAIEHEFSKVFMLTPQEGKEALITHWMQKSNCNRTYAMSLAVDEWRRENR
jgi:hypothetical protein